MQICANAKERSRDDWVALLNAADERFEIESITTPEHSALSIIEVIWKGGDGSNQEDLPELASAHDSDSDVAMGNDSFSACEPDSSSESESNYKAEGSKSATFTDLGTERPYAHDIRAATRHDYVPIDYESDGEGDIENSYTSLRYSPVGRRPKRRLSSTIRRQRFGCE